MRRVRVAIVGIAAVAAGCQLQGLDGEGRLGQDTQLIVGGNEVSTTAKWPAVAYLSLGGSACTGTLVAPSVILTASHCVEHLVEANSTAGSARFGIGAGDWLTDPIGYRRIHMHRRYAGATNEGRDVAMIWLDEAVEGITPIPYNRDALSETLEGGEVTTVGFGVSDPVGGTGGGIMREVDFTVTGVTAEHLVVGNPTRNACFGDSGGPTFLDFGGQKRVVGVSSFVSNNCQGETFLTRPDTYIDYLDEVLAAWDGPCSQDGSCNDSGECEFIDPDCDICGFDGFCGTECPTVDLDCELGALAGETCDDDFDCESRVCITAPDDERVKYCSAECDGASSVFEQCDAPLSACSDAGECVFAGPTPGTQGASCDGNDDCLGACDTVNSICVEPCSSQDDCSAEFECRDLGGARVCTVPSEDGGCLCSSTRPPSPVTALAALALGLLALRRRRRC